ncbi:hypothetical protein AAFN88_16480 [Pelagibius sp. CAU 1746]|uniref:hypothetical protein n=1 Tax=Pelagibius sp. CAU 1746 TaxID=3140370 RepID=UPI00325AA7DA
MTRIVSVRENIGLAASWQLGRAFARLAAVLRRCPGAGLETQRMFGSLERAARHDCGAGRDVQDYAVAPPVASSRRLHNIAEAARWAVPRL